MSTETITQTKIKIAKPRMFKVILINDNYTPMDFVIDVLVDIFHKTATEAYAITMQVHNDGKGVAGIYSYEVAEEKKSEAIGLAKANGHPLRLTVEDAD